MGRGLHKFPFPVPYELPKRIYGLDSDGEWLLYGTMTKLSVWNLTQHSLVHSYDVTIVRSVALNYPHAVVAGDGNKLVIWDLRTGQQVRKLGVDTAYAIHHSKSILVGSDNTWGDPMRHRINFFDLEQITNSQLNGPLWKRRKYLEDGMQAVKSCVNTSCVVAVQGNRLHVWDLWNCDQFNDNPDDFSDVGELSDDTDEFEDNAGENIDDPDYFHDNAEEDNEYPDYFSDNAEEYSDDPNENNEYE